MIYILLAARLQIEAGARHLQRPGKRINADACMGCTLVHNGRRVPRKFAGCWFLAADASWSTNLRQERVAAMAIIRADGAVLLANDEGDKAEIPDALIDAVNAPGWVATA